MKTDLNMMLADPRMRVTAVLIAVMFLAFASTVNPTVSFVDSGELATVATTLGIAHPTGYPLFTVLGRLVVMVLPVEPVTALNFFASFLVACAVGLFYNLVLEVTSSPVFFPQKKSSTTWDGIPAVIGSMMFGFSTTVWAQSVAVEVYSLHLVLALLFLWLLLMGIRESHSAPTSRFLLLSAFVAGLGFTNHMTMLLLIPAAAYLYGAAFGFRHGSWQRLIPILALFTLGLTLYLVLPLRSASRPLLDWGHPAGAERFLWHVSGKQYTSWIFSGFETARKQFDYFVTNYTDVFSWPSIVLAIIGMWAVFVYSRRLFWFIALLVAGCLAYAVNYDIHDIDSYFLLAYVGIALWMALGLRAVLDRLNLDRLRIMLVALFVLPAYEFWSHVEAVDESDNFLVDDYTKNILNSLDSNAVVLTFQWDYFVSPAYYFQFVQGIRPDVVVIDKELLRRSWYFLQLEKHYPWLIERSRSKINDFLTELYKFEHGLPYAGAVIEKRFDAVVNALLENALTDRPVYVGAEIETKFAPGYARVPEGLLLRLRRPEAVPSLEGFTYTFRQTDFHSRLTDGLRLQYAKMFTLRAIWLKNQEGKSREEVAEWLLRALEIDPAFSPARRFLMELRK